MLVIRTAYNQQQDLSNRTFLYMDLSSYSPVNQVYLIYNLLANLSHLYNNVAICYGKLAFTLTSIIMIFFPYLYIDHTMLFHTVCVKDLMCSLINLLLMLNIFSFAKISLQYILTNLYFIVC